MKYGVATDGLLPSFLLLILQLLQIAPKILISTKYGSKNASIVICKTTQAAENIVNILLAATHSFRQFIMRHAQRF